MNSPFITASSEFRDIMWDNTMFFWGAEAPWEDTARHRCWMEMFHLFPGETRSVKGQGGQQLLCRSWELPSSDHWKCCHESTPTLYVSYIHIGEGRDFPSRPQNLIPFPTNSSMTVATLPPLYPVKKNNSSLIAEQGCVKNWCVATFLSLWCWGPPTDSLNLLHFLLKM